MQAKPTFYNGYLFRSKLEAKWAVFFDKLRIPYRYEPEAFLCEDGSQYTPDFYLPESYLRGRPKGLYLEIKPLGWERDRGYQDRIASAFMDGRDEDGCPKGAGLVLFIGDPLDIVIDGEWRHDWRENPNEQLSPWWDNYMMLVFCESCNVLKAEFSEGNYMYCPVCGKDRDLDKISAAAEYARQFRFEYVHN